jgi:hypothetical protein
MYVIESDGPAHTPGMNRVINPRTSEVLTFASRADARAYRESILPEMPSKYLPLVVRPFSASQGAE